jgi:hypothetical protein
MTPAADLGMTFAGRVRSDANLRELEPRRQPKPKRGRKPLHGPRLPKLGALARQRSKFEEKTVSITIPRSKTQTRFARPYFACIASTIYSRVVTSFVLPAKTS